MVAAVSWTATGTCRTAPRGVGRSAGVATGEVVDQMVHVFTTRAVG